MSTPSPETADAAARRRARWPRGRKVLVVMLAVIGVATLAYPTVASMWNAHREAGAVEGYAETIAHMPEVDRAAELERAREYNADLELTQLEDPFASAAPVDAELQEDMAEYRSLLATDQTMARLRIPAIEVDLPIFHGTGEDSLQRGVGHLFGTHLPVGGEGNRTVLSGHRGLPDAQLFTRLDAIGVGDQMLIDVLGETLTYEVDDVRVVEPTDGSVIVPQEGQDLLTLITCTPIGINSHRLAVTGHRVPTPEDVAPAAESTVALTSQAVASLPWWGVLTVVILWGGLIFYVRWRRRCDDEADAA
ncbi:class C sortase [Demequina pelophila]|uniref:class C sortase n=1 Tax=Demequina pelophila TaxID=1638984 RepID=UPI001D0E2C77|nr:class C sortase [Demequina pelophila]